MRPGPGTCDRGGEHPRRNDGPIRGLWYAAPASIVLWFLTGATSWQLWAFRASLLTWLGVA